MRRRKIDAPWRACWPARRGVGFLNTIGLNESGAQRGIELAILDSNAAESRVDSASQVFLRLTLLVETR